MASLDAAAFTAPARQDTLVTKLDVVVARAAAGRPCLALSKLRHDVVPKVDGASPPADWLVAGATQELVAARLEAGATALEAEGGCS